ncbi:hypothetical protein TrST_g12266 [Triparma strigata]|uniref:Uncharacterized protein n=1 Tax=Triparma strigata TaxID=1606541 RepID=A0A9W7BKQ1_9STRA|nr:hypothetical protein TrST_g12266 [Triparma strigata]
MSGRSQTKPISIGDGSNTPKASNARQIPTTQTEGLDVGGTGGGMEERRSTVGFDDSADYSSLGRGLGGVRGLVSHSLPAPRAPFLRSRDPLDRLRNMPAIELPSPNCNGIVVGEGGGSSSLLSGHAFPSNFGGGGGGGGGVSGGVGVVGDVGGVGGGGGMSDIYPHSLPTYPNRDFIHRRWEETRVQARNRQGSNIGGAPASGGGIGSMLERDEGEEGDGDEGGEGGDGGGGGIGGMDEGGGGVGGGLLMSQAPLSSSIRDRSISSDSSDFNGGGGHGNSMSTSLTVFDILESSRPGLGVVLNANEVNNALNSRRETIEALQSVGGIEGEEIADAGVLGMEDEEDGDGEGEGDELGAFELDLDD